MTQYARAGYRTASIGKQHYVGRGSAFETEHRQVLSEHVHYYHYADGYCEDDYDVVKYPGDIYPWIFGGRFPASQEETAEAQVIRHAQGWLEDLQDEPFFLRISFNGPHTPVVPPAPYDCLIQAEAIGLPVEADPLPAGSPAWLSQHLARCADASIMSREQVLKMRQYYYGEAAFLDSLFGRMLAWLRPRGLLENTIVVVTSDHGTHLGDYGLVQKQTFFEPVVNVPFIYWWPGQVQAAADIRTPVSTGTLLPTLMGLAGLQHPSDCAELSLADTLLSGREPEPEPVFSELTLESFQPHVQHVGRLVLVRSGGWKLSLCLDPKPHDVAMYDLAADPLERTNLADDLAFQSQRDELLAGIQAHLDAGAPLGRG